MIKNIYSKYSFFKQFNLEIEEDNYYLFKTSGSEGNQKNVLIKCNVFINNFKKYIESLNIDITRRTLITSKMSTDHPYAFGLYSVMNDIIFYENIKDKIKYISEVDIIFTTPSFFINFKDFIKINKKQKIIFTGEEIPDSLKKELKDYNIYQSFGMTEALNIGIKKINDYYYDFIDDKINIENNYLFSPYLCSYIIENNYLSKIKDQYLISDYVEVKENKFCFLERESQIAKINEEKISLKMISNYLFSLKEIKDLVVFKTKKDYFDEINLFYSSSLTVQEVKKLLLERFQDINYIPKNIIKIDYIPITDLGKKDISKLINEYRI